MGSKIQVFLRELKRRKVYHVAAVYVVVGFGVASGAEYVFEMLGFPLAAARLVAVLILLGLPVALVLAWAYEMRPDKPQFTSMPGGGLPTLAVLPFNDFSPEPDQAYFAGGIHEEILTQLQKVGGLSIRGRTSVLRYRDDPKQIQEIAAELGVQYILEGSARLVGDQVRLTAQLMNAEKDEHLWAENYDRPLSLGNLISVQADIAQQVATELKAVITPEEEKLLAVRPTKSLDAYDEFLRGKHHAHKYTQAGFTRGIEHFEKAIRLDDAFALSYAGMGYCYKELSDLSYMDPAEGYPKAEAALRKAISFDDSHGEIHATLAAMDFVIRWDMSGPESRFRRAVELSPESADVFMHFGTYLMWLGRADQSIEALQRAVELEPLLPLASGWLGCALFYAHRYDESIQRHKRNLELDPGFVWSPVYLCHNYSQKGDHDQAMVWAEKVEAIARERGEDYLLTYVGRNYAMAGKEEKAREILEKAVELHAKGLMDAISIGVIYGKLNERDKALEWLNRGVDEHAGISVYLKVYAGTFLNELRADPRFIEVLRRVGFDT